MDWTFLHDPVFWTAAGAIGTVSAFVVAFVQIGIERSARKRAESEEQARRIAAWLDAALGGDEERMGAVISNDSLQPIFNVIASLVMLQGSGPERGEDDDSGDDSRRRLIGVLPPGRAVTTLSGPFVWAGMHRHPGIELAFTDAAGHHWIRRGDGRLQPIGNDPVKHYKLGRPIDWHGADKEAKSGRR